MIDLQQLTFPTTGAVTPILDAISLSISCGELVGLVGDADASALLRVLAGLESGWSGSIEIFRQPLREWSKSIYERIGVSIEHQLHFEALSARENLDFFASLYRVRTVDPLELLRRVELQAMADRPVRDFDHDQRRRLSMIRGLIHDPELWLLDRPFEALKPSGAELVRRLIVAQREQGRTVVLVTSCKMIADSLCDRIYELKQGGLTALKALSALPERRAA